MILTEEEMWAFYARALEAAKSGADLVTVAERVGQRVSPTLVRPRDAADAIAEYSGKKGPTAKELREAWHRGRRNEAAKMLDDSELQRRSAVNERLERLRILDEADELRQAEKAGTLD